MKIITFGDSITDAGRNREADVRKKEALGFGYPLLLQAELGFENPEKYLVINRGIGGNRIVDLYARVKKDVWNLQPDVLSIFIGVNDVWHDLSEQPNGVDLVRFEKVYRMLLDDTLAVLPNVKIMLIEPFVAHGVTTDLNVEHFAQVKDYAKVVRKLATEYKLPFLPLQEKFDELEQKAAPEYWTADGVHPTVMGAKMIANEWIKLFKAEIDK